MSEQQERTQADYDRERETQMATDYDRFKAEHPWLLWWEERKLALSEWWHRIIKAVQP